MGFSQSLIPIVRILNSDTGFWFTIPQLHEIARHLQNSRDCDTSTLEYETIAGVAISDTTVNDSLKAKYKRKIANLNIIIAKKDTVNKYLNALNNGQTKEIKKQKRQKKLVKLVALIIIVVSLFR